MEKRRKEISTEEGFFVWGTNNGQRGGKRSQETSGHKQGS